MRMLTLKMYAVGLLNELICFKVNTSFGLQAGQLQLRPKKLYS